MGCEPQVLRRRGSDRRFPIGRRGNGGLVKQQFFPASDRPEVLVEVQMPEGTSIEATTKAAMKVEGWLRQQPEAKIVTTYIGRGAPRFFFSYNPELPDPSFAKLIVLTLTRRRASGSRSGFVHRWPKAWCRKGGSGSRSWCLALTPISPSRSA